MPKMKINRSNEKKEPKESNEYNGSNEHNGPNEYNGSKETKETKETNKSLQRHYVSELDQFLQNFDKKPEAFSNSRYAEQAKYEKIGQLRDNPNAGEPSGIFKDF